MIGKEFFFTSKPYQLCQSAYSRYSYNISIPTAVLRHQAEIEGMTVEEFARKFEMIAKYVDDKPGFMIYEFSKIDESIDDSAHLDQIAIEFAALTDQYRIVGITEDEKKRIRRAKSNLRARRWRIKNREHHLEYMKNWREENREDVDEYQRNYRKQGKPDRKDEFSNMRRMLRRHE